MNTTNIEQKRMHDLWVCSNKCCDRYKPGYAEAIEWVMAQPPIESLKINLSGYRMCNHCGADNSWEDRACPECGTRFGMLKPDPSIENVADERLPLPDPPSEQQSDNQDESVQCAVCDWYNPRDLVQCERCTTFLLHLA